MNQQILLAIFLVVITLLIANFIVDTSRSRRLKRKKEDISRKLQLSKSYYSNKIKGYCKNGVISKQHESKFLSLINNFFVMQPVNTSSAKNYIRLVKDLTSAMDKAAAESQKHQMAAQLQDALMKFVMLIPNESHAFNSSFYQTDMPRLVKKLKSTRFESTDSGTLGELDAQAA